MASVGHVVVGMAAARWFDRRVSPGSLAAGMVAWPLLSLLPDADVVGFWLGVAYHEPWGHRGASHSLAAALVAGVAVALSAWVIGVRPARTGALAAVVVGSHGILDSLTDGGLGPALLWPLSDERIFAPWNPIPVAPIGLGFLSPHGLRVAFVELMLFSPLLLYAAGLFTARRKPTDSRAAL